MPVAIFVDTLPQNALQASAFFREHAMKGAQQHLREGRDIVLVLPAAPFDHDDWRRTAVHDLARAYAPARVNMVAGGTDDEINHALRYLEHAPGVTGQYLALRGAGRFDE